MTQEELSLETDRLIYESKQICWALRERWIEDHPNNIDNNLEELINEETNFNHFNLLAA